MGQRVAGRNRVRIIGGEFRGRQIGFADESALRPTTDRIRETLFNWLSYDISGSSCLDLFAGSGVLGFEALSRGARRVVMVDASPRVAEMLKENAARLGVGDSLGVVREDALHWLRTSPPDCFDIVFVDPPFAAGLVTEVLALLESSARLARGALIYVEQDARQPLPPLPATWEILREKRAGQVAYRLIRAGANE